MGRYAQHQERVSGTAFPEIDFNSQMAPNATVLYRDEINAEPAKNPLFRKRAGYLCTARLNVQPIRRIGWEPAAEENLPIGTPQDLIMR